MLFLIPLALTAVIAQQPETLSLLEEPLYPPPVSQAERARLEDAAAHARAELAKNPANADAVLELARAQRGLGHVGDSLETLTRALENKTDTPAIHLERGRGFMIIRKFDLAQKESRKAVEALPEAHCDIGLALYLLGDYKAAHDEYAACKEPGVLAYLAGRRAGLDGGPKPSVPEDSNAKAPVTLPGAVSRESKKPAASFAGAYMEAVDRLLAGDKNGARDRLKPLVEKQRDRWMEPIYIAAEADYARLYRPAHKKKKKKKK